MEKKVVITIQLFERKEEYDIEVPLDISVEDFIDALSEAYDLSAKFALPENRFLRADSPIAFLKGEHLLYEYGIRNGTVINIL